MSGNIPDFLTCSEIRRRLRTHFLAQSEIPMEHAVSFPLPTKRWGGPAYAMFASPALRIAGRPPQQDAPDRWWTLNARTGRLEIFALCSALRFADANWERQEVHAPSNSVAAMREALAKIELGLNGLAPAFFTDGSASENDRAALKQSLLAGLPAKTLPQYQALTPDFWAWLEK